MQQSQAEQIPGTSMIRASEYFASDTSSISPDAEARFYGSLKMHNGTFKTTSSGRFSEIDPEIAEFLLRRFPDSLEILDVGVSAGISTAEFFATLNKAGLSPSLIATDLYTDAFLVELWGQGMVLADRNGWPLQYEIGSHVVKPWIRRLDFLTLAAPLKFVASRLLRQKLAQMIAEGRARKVKLESRSVLEAGKISLLDDDIFVRRPEFERRFDFIRAANILNVGYFSEPDLRVALRNIAGYLSGPGSLLLVVRSGERDGVNDGTLFELSEEDSFVPVRTFGRGTEILPLVLSC